MAKKRIRANTLSGLWKNISRIAPAYLESDSEISDDILSEIQLILEEVNGSSVPASIASNFILPYMHKDKCFVEFSGNDSLGMWTVQYEEEEAKMHIDPIGLYKFVSYFKKAGSVIEESNLHDENFREYRQLSFMKAISKMPEPYFVYIAVLQEVAILNNIVSYENRNGGYIQSEASFYLSVLWAFKEFERFYLGIQHRHLRSDYGIIWHEGEWIEERKTRGYV